MYENWEEEVIPCLGVQKKELLILEKGFENFWNGENGTPSEGSPQNKI